MDLTKIRNELAKDIYLKGLNATLMGIALEDVDEGMQRSMSNAAKVAILAADQFVKELVESAFFDAMADAVVGKEG